MSTPTPARIPFIKGLPLLGNMLEMATRRDLFMLRLSRECDDLCAFRLGPYVLYFVNSPELVNEVFVEKAACFEKPFRMQRDFGPIIGNGLLTSRNDFHRRQRKLVAPAFHHRRMANYGAVMVNYTSQIQAGWADGAVIDMLPEMVRLTLWIVAKALYDADVREDTDGVSEAVRRGTEVYSRRLAAPFLSFPLSWPVPGNKALREVVDLLNQVVYRIIRERRASGEDRGDLLSILLKVRDEDDGSFMTDQQVRDEVMTLFLAGHETTANALTWTFYLLARHPEVYDRLIAEAQALPGPPTPDDLGRLPYALKVFKEALRLYPPVYLLGRQVVAPVQIGPYQLKHGVVIISPYAMHRRPELFPDPQRFWPERWSPEFEQRLPRQAYIPFAGGSRICIGNHFALMEGQLVLATICQQLRLELTNPQPIDPDAAVALQPSQPVRLRVRRLRPAAPHDTLVHEYA